MISFRPALASEAPRLSELAYSSKQFWGYDDAFMDMCREELRIHPDDCTSGLVTVARDTDEVVGFYQLLGSSPRGELADLFVDPDYIGRGIGSQLFRHALSTAATIGLQTLEIHSDPHAKDFYIHMGALVIGETESGSIPGRLLPVLEIATS